MPPPKRVDAKVVEVADNIQPIESVVVGDKRSSLGKRLGVFAVAILLLFFSINGYISSAQNSGLLHRAAKDRSELVDTVTHLSHTNDAQTKLIKQLQHVLRKQNKLLRKHGFRTVIIPGAVSSGGSQNNSKNASNGHKHHQKHQPQPSHSPTPNPTITPSPKPTNNLKHQICKLTGICLNPKRSQNAGNLELQSLRRTQVDCNGSVTGFWNIIFCAFQNLGFV